MPGWLRWLAVAAGLWIVFGSPLGDAAGATEAPDAVAVEQADRPSDQEHGADEAAHADEGEHLEVRDFFFVLILILLFGKMFGELAERWGQPAVLGELIAGVVLGSSVLAVLPASGPVAELVHIFAEIGVSILLFEIGLETDLKEMFRVGPTASAVALVGVVLPFGLGFLYWYFAQPAIGIDPQGISFAIVAIFVGATLTATSVGITARVLSDLNRMHTPDALALGRSQQLLKMLETPAKIRALARRVLEQDLHALALGRRERFAHGVGDQREPRLLALPDVRAGVDAEVRDAERVAASDLVEKRRLGLREQLGLGRAQVDEVRRMTHGRLQVARLLRVGAEVGDVVLVQRLGGPLALVAREHLNRFATEFESGGDRVRHAAGGGDVGAQEHGAILPTGPPERYNPRHGQPGA